jgi:hypothetical protein
MGDVWFLVDANAIMDGLEIIVLYVLPISMVFFLAILVVLQSFLVLNVDDALCLLLVNVLALPLAQIVQFVSEDRMDILHVVTYVTATGLAQDTGAVRVQETASALMAGLEKIALDAARIITMHFRAVPNVPQHKTV